MSVLVIALQTATQGWQEIIGIALALGFLALMAWLEER